MKHCTVIYKHWTVFPFVFGADTRYVKVESQNFLRFCCIWKIRPPPLESLWIFNNLIERLMFKNLNCCAQSTFFSFKAINVQYRYLTFQISSNISYAPILWYCNKPHNAMNPISDKPTKKKWPTDRMITCRVKYLFLTYLLTYIP